MSCYRSRFVQKLLPSALYCYRLERVSLDPSIYGVLVETDSELDGSI